MLAIGRALISNPRLLLLDEPSLGLAPNAVHDLYATIRERPPAGRGMLIADQNAAAACAIADRAYVLQTGRIVAHGKPARDYRKILPWLQPFSATLTVSGVSR